MSIALRLALLLVTSVWLSEAPTFAATSSNQQDQSTTQRASTSVAQNEKKGPPPAQLPAGFNAYPTRPPADPAAVDRGKTLFSVNCSFCHGSTAKGGEGGGPNLVRSELVLDDKDGELIASVVQNGRLDRGMPKFDLTAAQISDIAAFIHSFPVGGRASRGILTNPVVGDAKAGEAYFNQGGKCSSCHSITGDLAGIGLKYDARSLQAAFLTGGASGRARSGTVAQPVAPTTVTVTLSSGEKIEGTLNSVDDFFVSLTDAAGHERTFSRSGATPKVELHNPLQVHMDMWRTLTDTQIHDLTAYLVTLQ